MKALAIDVAPYQVYDLHGGNKINWDSRNPLWLKMGLIGESVGLSWGGRWKDRPDYGHFQYKSIIAPEHADGGFVA